MNIENSNTISKKSKTISKKSKTISNKSKKSNTISKITDSCKLGPFKKVRTHRIEIGVKRCLIVENMQNCFFTGGSMGFKSRGDETLLLKKVNQLISLHEVDKQYVKASKSGKEKKKLLGGIEEGFDTNSRKKNYFDIIIFTQDGNPPDHWTFASHHFLRDPKKFDYFSGSSKDRKKTFKCTGKKCKRKSKILLPDHALTDGSDTYKSDGIVKLGIEFHSKLDVRPLYRPSAQFNQSVFIKKPLNYNRGFIVFKGGVKIDDRSAFEDSLNNETGLGNFLKCNGINSLFICGMGRERNILNSLIDSLKVKTINERVIVYDATMPIAIDYIEDNSALKNTINNNNFVDDIRKKGMKVVIFDDLINSVKKGETIHDRDQPKGTFSKSIRNMETLFSGS